MSGAERHASEPQADGGNGEAIVRASVRAFTIEDEEDMSDIVSLLEALVGNDVAVTSSYEVLHWRGHSLHDEVRWIYFSRAS